MPNLSIRPMVVIPGGHVSEDFPTIGTDNHSSDFKQSDFSKTFADAINSKHTQPEDFSASRKQSTLRSADNSLVKKPAVAKEPQQPHQADQKEAPASHVKESENKSTQSDSQPKSDSGQSKAESTVAPADNKDKTTDTKTKQDPTTVDASTVSTLLAQISTVLQPLADNTSVTANINLDQTVNQVSPVLTVAQCQTLNPITAIIDPK